jgi:N utilization substance protein A
MNARLAARLTGWKVDIQSEREFAEAEAEAAFGGSADGADEFSGRCAAILANGKRCPNAALPGTRFCGVPAHQALAQVEAETGTFAEGSVQPVPPQAEGEEALEGEGEEALPAEQVIAQADGDTAVEGEVAAEPEPVEEETQPAA